jgi:dihydroxyacetone kinase phosphoprotein-dependent L subunit
MKNTLSADDCKALINYTADKIIESKPLLTEADSAIGDGDHGIGMELGMSQAKEKIAGLDAAGNAYKVFETAGMAMLVSMGGASGVIFGSMFQAGAKGASPKAELSAADIAGMFEKSLAAIKERGRANIGDKTMVDAFEPAVEAMKANAGLGMLKMFESAEHAACEGMESTKNMTAKIGRSKSLMDRSVGFLDPGAVSVWIIIRSMREFVEN